MSEIITVKDMCLWYSQTQALKNININIEEKSITALIGPSGCGKSTFLKTLNRMNDLVPGVKITGDIRYRLEQIDLIKKAILARAFRGELDTNDPNEELSLIHISRIPFR